MMKRALQIIVVLGFAGMFLMTPVAAATSDGLEWGTANGDHFRFTLAFTSTTEDNFSEEMYINVTDTPAGAIPDPLTDWADIPDDWDLDFRWANDTSMGLATLIFLGIIAVGGMFVVPTGNWTHLSELVSVSPLFTGESIIDNSNEWGISWEEDTSATEKIVVTATYNKVDGFLARYSLENWDTSSNTMEDSWSATRIGAPSGGIVQLLMDNILYVGIGVVAILIIGVVVCKRK